MLRDSRDAQEKALITDLKCSKNTESFLKTMEVVGAMTAGRTGVSLHPFSGQKEFSRNRKDGQLSCCSCWTIERGCSG